MSVGRQTLLKNKEKIMKKLIIIIALIVLQSTNTFAQTAKLKVGETMPDFSISRILNYEKKATSFKEVKRKLTIIDFWGTWCGACVAYMPKISLLQEKFKDNVQFILVTSEDELRVSRFIQARPALKLPIILDTDETIFKLFQPAAYPRYIVIDESQKILAMTNSDHINEINIDGWLAGKQIDIPIIKESLFENNQPLSGNDNLSYQSVFRSYFQGVPSMTRVIFQGTNYENRRILVTNLPIPVLFRTAYQVPATRIIFEIKDKSVLDFDNKSNRYCYDLIVPESLGEKRFQMMQEDLARYFSNIKTKLEMRMTKVYLIKVLSKEKLNQIKTKGGKPELILTDSHFAAYNKSLSEIGVAFDNFVGKPMVTDVENDFNLDVDFDTKMSNINEIRKEFNKIGLDLVEAERLVKMPIISDN
jgi:thiol-disulfide isomerase/thioredoxin